MIKITVTTTAQNTPIGLYYGTDSTPTQSGYTDINKKIEFSYVDDSANYTIKVSDPDIGDKIISSNHAVIS